MDTRVFKIKFGKRENLIQMQNEGLIYCNTIKYFTEIEDGKVRGDKNESAIEIETFKEHILYIKPFDKPDAEYTKVYATWGQKVLRNNDLKGNIFCLYAAELNSEFKEGPLALDDRLNEFGTHALIIKNTPEFLSRLFNQLEQQDIPYIADYVEYIDLRNFSGRKNLFQKDINYSYQKEYRILLKNDQLEPVKLYIGDISDISSIYDYSVVKRLVFKRV